MKLKKFLEVTMNEAPPLPSKWDAEVYNPSSSFKKRIDYAVKRAQKMGTGSSRVAFNIRYKGQPTVLKVAKNKKGIAQNEFEAGILSDHYLQRLGTAISIIDYDKDNYTWIHTRKAAKLKAARFKKFFGMSPSDLYYLLDYLTTGKIPFWIDKNHIKKLNSLRGKNEHLEHVIDMVLSFGLPTDDFGRLANWGEYRRRPVVIDLGLSHDIYKQYYESINEDDWYSSDDPRKNMMLMRAMQMRREQQQGQLDIIENPTHAQFMKVAREAAKQTEGPQDPEGQAVKGLYDPTREIFYIWNPWYSIHADIEARLINKGHDVEAEDWSRITGHDESEIDDMEESGYIAYTGWLENGKIKHYMTWSKGLNEPAVRRALGGVSESINEDWTPGARLSDTGYQYGVARVYRAAPATVSKFRTGDYITMSRKFAKEHADHVAAVDEEDAHVLSAMVKSHDVYLADNPGEYRYYGPDALQYKVIHKSPAVVGEIVHGTQQSTHSDDPAGERVEPWVQAGADFATAPHGWHESINEARTTTITPEIIQDIKLIVKKVHEEEGCDVTDPEQVGYCHIASEILHYKYGWEAYSGVYLSKSGEPIADHVWNVLPDGTILDSTPLQFHEGHDIRIIPPNDPEHKRYRFEWSGDYNPDHADQYPELKGVEWSGEHDLDAMNRLRKERGPKWWLK